MSDKKIIDYDILLSEEINSLIQQVQTKIKSGWQPTGGISITVNGNYIQAIVKVEQK